MSPVLRPSEKGRRAGATLRPLGRLAAAKVEQCRVRYRRRGSCQKRGVAYPRLPYLRRGETMLSDVRVPLVIRPEVTTNG